MLKQTLAKPYRLEDWAERQPNKIAFIEVGDNEHRQMTYAQWNTRANCLAHAMAAKGIGAESIVATRLKNGIDWAIINAALAKLGAANLGVNWRLTSSELKFILQDGRATALFCDDEKPELLVNAFGDLALKLLVSTRLENPITLNEHNKQQIYPLAAFLDFPETPPFFSQTDARLIIYTSGTTGFPKGVMTNRSARTDDIELRDYLLSVRSTPSSDADIALVTMPMHHGAGPGIIRTGTARASTMILLPRFDPEKVLQLIERYKVTTWNGVPTMYKRLAALPDSVLKKYDVSSIKALSVGAAPVPYSLKEWIIHCFGPVLKEGYGSTEVGMVTSLPPELQTKKIGSSGKPFQNVKISIRDDQGQELPVNQVGEIWVYTPVAIPNYLNKDPLGTETVDEKGFFRMGDMGKVDEEGFLYITDRTHDMIISGGVNIYPAEIEHALIQHPNIQDVAVIGIPDDEFGEQVKAFIEPRPGFHINVEQVNCFAKVNLASYKRPKSVDIVDELPRNTMGKLLKRELRDPFWQDRERNV